MTGEAPTQVGGVRWRYVAYAVVMAGSAAGCRGDLLRVSVPPNAIPTSAVHDSAAGEALRAGAIATEAYGAVVTGASITTGAYGAGGMMADEFYITVGDQIDIAADTRSVRAGGVTAMDAPYTSLQQARIQSIQAVGVLESIVSTAGSSDVGEMFALAGYAEVLLAEHMCSGIPLGVVTLSGTVTNGDPLPTDSVLGTAIMHFDSASAHAGGSPLIASLAAVGRGRALLDRGHAADAGAAVASVAPGFIYTFKAPDVDGQDLYVDLTTGGGINMADSKGTNGLPYISAHDPRLPTMTVVGPTPVGTVQTAPMRFPNAAAGNSELPLADGVEAGLVLAEAALSAHDVNGWLGALNALRANFVALRGPYPVDTSYHQLQPLVDPGSDNARVDLMFRERAFWLYGTGHRLGDMRRLLRWYGRDQSQVFPVGAYVNGTASQLRATYGTDVNFPLGPVEQGNPKFHGCLNVST
jgi:hypothetical protein